MIGLLISQMFFKKRIYLLLLLFDFINILSDILFHRKILCILHILFHKSFWPNWIIFKLRNFSHLSARSVNDQRFPKWRVPQWIPLDWNLTNIFLLFPWQILRNFLLLFLLILYLFITLFLLGLILSSEKQRL